MTAQHENRREQYQTRHAIPNTQREKYFEHNINPNCNKNIQEKENEIEKAKPKPFLDDLRNEAPMRFENGFTECLERRKFRKKMNSYKCPREN